MNYIPTIRVGDMLLRPEALGFLQHVGVAIAPDRVLQNTRDRGEHVTTLQGFSAGKPVTVRRSDAHPAIVRARAEAVLANPQPYDPVLNNCEHTASKIIHGIARSPQLAFIVIMAVVALLIVMFSRR